MTKKNAGTLALLTILTLAGATLLGADEDRTTPHGINAVTRPSADRLLSFVRPGRVADVYIKEGDEVKKGQLLAKQDDSEELATLEELKSEADDETEINAEKLILAKDQTKYEYVSKNNGTSTFEKMDAEQSVQVDQARVTLAMTKKKQAGYKYTSGQAVVEKMKLYSPIDGQVDKNSINVGEVTDAQGTNKTMRIVQIDPLWIEVPAPILQARRLKAGDPAQVLFTDKKIRSGKVQLVFPVGDSGAEMIPVRVEVPNPEKLQPGENVYVTFGDSSVADSSASPR
jgi:HlyD family secretion protein